MLAGFLSALRSKQSAALRLTCCSPFDRASQRARLPVVEVLEDAPAPRDACTGRCHAWLGLGDRPFQGDLSPWFLDHLSDELAGCRRHVKPMYFLGIGLNSYRDVDH